MGDHACGYLFLLASRVALFQEDWEEVIRTSEEFIDLGGNELYDLNDVDRGDLRITGAWRKHSD